MNIQNSKTHKIAQLKIGGKIINNSKDVSNKLNEYLVHVGPSTEITIPKTQHVSALKFMKQRNQCEF